MELYGLIGYPLGHSFSKKYFTQKFESSGMNDCRYELFSIESISLFGEIIRNNPSLKGLNVTIPYKKAVLAYLDDRSDIPKGLNACNCIKIIDGRTMGYNTDVIGFERSIMARLKPHHNSALILGNGGATEAVKFVFTKNNISYKVVGRKGNTDFTYDQLNETIIASHTVIVNTTPLGMYPDENTCPEIPYRYINSKHHLFDLVYNPEKTLFLKKGEELGATVQNGYEMLLLQAEESWKIWERD
jgi:shikimate dehydrogenase